jgi:hypothetical protein
MGVSVGNELFDDHYRNSEAWYDTSFIAGFCTLLYHDAHSGVPPRPPYTNDHRILMVHCPYPSAQIKTVLAIPNDCTHFVSLVLNAGHFAVLYYDLRAKSISVFDGLNWKVDNWQKHMIHTLKSFGLESIDDDPKCVFTEKTEKYGANRERTTMMLQIKFEDGKSEWTARNERHHRQKDGFNCGPIAMLKLLEIFGWIKVGAMDTIAYTTPAGYRGFVMNMFKMLKDKYYDLLVVDSKLSTNKEGDIPFLTAVNTATPRTEPVDTALPTSNDHEPNDTAPLPSTNKPVDAIQSTNPVLEVNDPTPPESVDVNATASLEIKPGHSSPITASFTKITLPSGPPPEHSSPGHSSPITASFTKITLPSGPPPEHSSPIAAPFTTKITLPSGPPRQLSWHSPRLAEKHQRKVASILDDNYLDEPPNHLLTPRSLSSTSSPPQRDKAAIAASNIKKVRLKIMSKAAARKKRSNSGQRWIEN